MYYEHVALDLYQILNLLLEILPTKEKQEKKTTPCEDTIEKNIKPFLTVEGCGL